MNSHSQLRERSSIFSHVLSAGYRIYCLLNIIELSSTPFSMDHGGHTPKRLAIHPYDIGYPLVAVSCVKARCHNYLCGGREALVRSTEVKRSQLILRTTHSLTHFNCPTFCWACSNSDLPSPPSQKSPRSHSDHISLPVLR